MATGFAHINLIARDWKRLSTFYQEVFGCTPVLPERDLSGEWLDRATGLARAHISGEAGTHYSGAARASTDYGIRIVSTSSRNE